MGWLVFVLGAVISWGLYGPALHRGQVALGHPMRALLCIGGAFRAGGSPLYVMPLVFGGAPLVNVLVTLSLHPPKTAPNPMLYAGFVLAAIGAALVLYFKPQS